MQAGVIPVRASGDTWTLQSQCAAHAPGRRFARGARGDARARPRAIIGAEPLWVDTGSEQLVMPLASADAVRRCQPDAELLARAMAACRYPGRTRARWPTSGRRSAPGRRAVRFFFPKHGAVIEDPGTGSACANLGGWLVATGATRPRTLALEQGEAVGRRCRLGLTVDPRQDLRLRARRRVGRGTIEL